MKRMIIIIFSLLTVIVLSLYIFIPNVILLKSETSINATEKGLQRILLDKQSMAKWWPGKSNKDSFYLNNYTYLVYNNNTSSIPITMDNKEIFVKSSLFISSLQKDSVTLEWVGKTASSNNPVKRITAYLNARQLNKDMDMITMKMKAYFSSPKNIYGFDINNELVEDAMLISTSGNCSGYPTTEFIYELINKLRQYATEQSTKVTGYPMLNIEPISSRNYLVRVALPLEKLIPSRGDILQKRMLKSGNILVTEATGGNLNASKALNEIINYANDYGRSSPAIPFYSLVTDRIEEPDSTKWITKIYYPVR